MKDLNKTEWGMPQWPSFYEFGDGYQVKGFCRGIFNDTLLVFLMLFSLYGGIMLGIVFHVILSLVYLGGLSGLFFIVAFFGSPVACYHYFTRHYGKHVTVTFFEKVIRIQGKVIGDFPVLPDQVSFRMRPHEKIRLRKRVESGEAEKLQDYGEIVMEYGLQTYVVCEIANLNQAQMFTRILNEGFKRSQAMKPIFEPSGTHGLRPVDVDDLPE